MTQTTQRDDERIQAEFKLTQEGISLSVYDLNTPRGCELIEEYWTTWSEIGLERHAHTDNVTSKRLLIKPDGTLSIKKDIGV